MNEVTPFQPRVGLTSIQWNDAGRPTLPGASEAAGMLGARVRQSLRDLYDQVTTKDILLGMTVPHITDPDLLLPHKFEAALMDVIEKMEAGETTNPKERHVASADVRQIWDACVQWQYNRVALNMA